RSLAQEDSWKTISPAGESFTTLMPTQAVEVSRLIPLSDHDSVRERVYYSLAPGKRYMIVSFMKTAPDRLMALSSFDNFMLGINQSFKAPNKDGLSRSLVFDRDVAVKGA